jgi:hypothetical protein
MKLQSNRSMSGHSSLGLLPPFFLMIAAGGLLGVSVEREHGLRADVTNDQDEDHDGLVDAEELILGTSPTNADTDHDGYSDLEELARWTPPTLPQFHPDDRIDNSLALGMSCHWENGKIHALMALYVPDSNLHDKMFRVGMLVGHRIGMIPEQALLTHARMKTYPAHDAHATIAVVDLPFSPSLVHAYGSVTVFAMSGVAGSGVVTAADAVQLIDIGGVTVYCKVDHTPMMNMTSVNGHQHASAGLIYIPLGDDGPLNWTPGAVCHQETEEVGTSGNTVTEEVVSASCVDGWDTACPPGCADTVGTTSETVDPLHLLGG